MTVMTQRTHPVRRGSAVDLLSICCRSCRCCRLLSTAVDCRSCRSCRTAVVLLSTSAVILSNRGSRRINTVFAVAVSVTCVLRVGCREKDKL